MRNLILPRDHVVSERISSGLRTFLVFGFTCLATIPALADAAKPQPDAETVRQKSIASNVTLDKDPAGDPTGARDPERVDDSYQPKGMEFGQFVYFPSIEFAERYNSNIFAQKDDPKADLATVVIPKIELRSRFSEHALNMTAQAEKVWMRKYSSDDQLNGEFDVDSRYDFNRDWTADAGINLRRSHEDRSSPDDVGGNEPTPVDSFSGNLGSKVRVEKYTFSGDFDVNRQTFGDVETSSGTSINNGDRDRTEFVATGRATYELFPGYAAIAELQGNRREYDDRFDDAGYERSSQGWQARTGIGVDISQLVRGDFTVGYLQQDYEDDRFNDLEGMAFQADFTWTPNRMTVVVPSFGRSVRETTTLDASGIIQTSASLLVRHEYARNIVVSGNLSATQDDFQGLDRTDETYEGLARVTWALAPEYYLGGEASYRMRDSTDATAEYDQYVIAVRFGLRM